MGWNRQELVELIDVAIDQNATIAALKEDVSGLKVDILRLESKIDTQVADLQTKIAAQGADLEAKIAAQGADLEAKIEAQGARLEAKIEAQGARLEAKIEAQGARLEAKIDRQGRQLMEMIHHQGLRQDDMERNIKLILDAVIPAQQRADSIHNMEEVVEQHEVRLTVVETSLSLHLRQAKDSNK